MKFHKALKLLQNRRADFIRRKAWTSDVKILLHVESSTSARYAYVVSRSGRVPWMPTQIEMLTDDDWEVYY